MTTPTTQLIAFSSKIAKNKRKLYTLEDSLSDLIPATLDSSYANDLDDNPTINSQNNPLMSTLFDHLKFGNSTSTLLDLSYMGAQNRLHERLTGPHASILDLISAMRDLISCHYCEFTIGSLALNIISVISSAVLFLLFLRSLHVNSQAKQAYLLAARGDHDLGNLATRISRIEKQFNQNFKDNASNNKLIEKVNVRLHKVNASPAKEIS